MKMSKREIIIGMATLAAILFGFTYWMAGSKISEHREMAEEKIHLKRQIKLHQRILEEKKNWIGRLDTLQSQIPVYNRRTSVNIELPKMIKRMADQHGLDLLQTTPVDNDQIGSLYELSVRCDWQGDLEALVHFLHELHAQGIRFDVRKIDIKPIAKQEGLLKGSMIINCAYRQAEDK